MFSVVFLFALLAFSATGSPVEFRNSTITLPMTRRLAFSNVTDLFRHDEARLAAFGEYSTRGRRDADTLHPTVPLSQADLGDAMVGYTVRVAIGYPPANYELIVDSASAITWIGGGAPYVSFTGIDTNVPVAVNHGYGAFQGTIWRDTIAFTERLTIPRMYIGVASAVQGVAADGVLGIGPISSSPGALPNSQTIPTVIDRLCQQESILRPVVSIFFKPTVANEDNSGELCFGGANPGIYLRQPRYTDIATTHPSSLYWGINLWITYANTEILARSPGIVDSGCTFLYLSIDAYERYRALTGGTLNPENGLLQISLQQYDQLHDLQFHTGTILLKLVPNAQIWPRSLNNKIQGGDNDIFLIVKSLPTAAGAGCTFVSGYVFLQRFYTVFDSDRGRVGFAPTVFTEASTN